MSNEIEKVMKLSCFYKINLQGIPWKEGVEWIGFSLFLSLEQFIVFSYVKFAFLMFNVLSYPFSWQRLINVLPVRFLPDSEKHGKPVH